MTILHRASIILAAVAACSAPLWLAACGGPRLVQESWSAGHPKREGQLVSGMQEGEWSYWYDNGQQQAKGGWKGDKQFGAWTWWWPNGQVQSRGQYLEGGTRTGHWQQYHDDGKLASEGDYDRNRQDGMWRFWYPDGTPYAEGFFDFGVKSGPWRTWNHDGTAQSQGAYFLGLKVGPWSAAGAEATDLGAPRGFVGSHLAVDGKPVAWAMTRTGRQADGDRLLDFPLRGIDGACLLMASDGAMRWTSNLGGRGMAAAWDAAGRVACAGHTIDGQKDGAWRYWQGDQLIADLAYERGRLVPTAAAPPAGDIAPIDAWCQGFAIAADATGEGALAAASEKRATVAQRVAAGDAGNDAAAAPAGRAEPQKLEPEAPAAAAPAATSATDDFAPFDTTPTRPATTQVAGVQPVPLIAAPAAAQPAQLDLIAPDPTAPSLSPMQVLPSFWTKAEEGNAAHLIERYSTGSVSDAADDPYAVDTSVKSQRPDLIGKPLPQMRFLGANGSVIDVASYKKPLVLVVLRGFGGQVCLYCATQTAALAKHIDDFHQAGAEVVVLYPGPAESAPAFIQAVRTLSKEPPPMPVALDVSLLLVRALGIEDNLSRPTSLVIDRAGKVRYAYVGKTIADRPSADDLLREVRRIVE